MIETLGQWTWSVIAKPGGGFRSETEDILHAETRSRASTKWDHVFAQLSFGRLKPSFWLKGAGVGEEVGVIVEHDRAHAYRSLERSGVCQCRSSSKNNFCKNKPNIRFLELSNPCTVGRCLEKAVGADGGLHIPICLVSAEFLSGFRT